MPIHPQDRRSDKSVLRVGTFNVDWLFTSPLSNTPWRTPLDAMKHIEAVAVQIHRSEADVLAIHEVQNTAVLDLLLLHLGPVYRYYIVPGTDTATGQNSALLTKIDPSSPVCRSEGRATYPVGGSGCPPLPKGTRGQSGVSKHGFARIAASTFSFDFIFAHFKAGMAASDCHQRTAQAQVLQDIQQQRSFPTILAGDFNDFDDEFADAAGNRGQGRGALFMLKRNVTRSYGVLGVSEPPANFVNAGKLLPPSMRASFGSPYRTIPGSLIDHVLVADALAGRIESVVCDGSPYPATVSERVGLHLSDHLPVVVTLRDEGSAMPEVSPAVMWSLLGVLVLAVIVAFAVRYVPRMRRVATPDDAAPADAVPAQAEETTADEEDAEAKTDTASNDLL